MKSYGKIDFEGGGAGLKDLKIDSGDAFPTAEVGKGYLFWLNGVGPHVHTGSAWLPILIGQQDHASFSGLANDDHAQYVHLNIARIISAQHTFAPSSVKAPFVLNINAQGQKVIGLNADQLDGRDSTEFVLNNTLAKPNGVATLDANGHVLPNQLPILANGMPAYLEPTLNKLISIASATYVFGVVSTGTRNVYLNSMGLIASNTLGIILPRNAIVRSVTVTLSATTSSGTSAAVQLRVNNATTAIATYSIPDASDRSINLNLGVSLNAGDELQLYLAAAKNVTNPLVFVEISWRD